MTKILKDIAYHLYIDCSVFFFTVSFTEFASKGILQTNLVCAGGSNVEFIFINIIDIR